MVCLGNKTTKWWKRDPFDLPMAPLVSLPQRPPLTRHEERRASVGRGLLHARLGAEEKPQHLEETQHK